MAAPLQISTENLLQKSREAEDDGNLEEAASLYEQVIKSNKLEELPFDRLMILYRKMKQYKDELRIINKGISLFEKSIKKPTRKNSAKSEKLILLSNAFMKNAGLKDKKGNLLYIPEPISRWMKRKVVVERKLKK